MSERDEARIYVEEFDRAWCEYDNPYYPGKPIRRDRDWTQSIRRFRSAGLDLDVLLEFVDAVMENDNIGSSSMYKWRYLCGCAWRHLKGVSA